MKLFLWVNIALCALTCIGKLVMLADGFMLPRNATHEAVDVALNGVLVVWASILLYSLYQ